MVTWKPPAAGEYFDAQARIKAEQELRQKEKLAETYDPASLIAGGPPPEPEAAPPFEVPMPAPLGGQFAPGYAPLFGAVTEFDLEPFPAEAVPELGVLAGRVPAHKGDRSWRSAETRQGIRREEPERTSGFTANALTCGVVLNTPIRITRRA